MTETTPTAPTPYDYADAQRLLNQRQALAQALIGTQMPAAGKINRANIGGSQYSFFVPNKAGMVSAALQKILGGYELGKTNDEMKQDQQNQRSAVAQALAGLTPTITGSQDVNAPLSNSQQSNLDAANAPDASAPGLSGVDTSNVPGQQPVVSGPSPQDRNSAITALMQAGPMGQAYAQRFMAPPKMIATKPGESLNILDPFTGQPVAPAIGSQGPDPKLAAQFRADAAQTDPSNPQALQALYSRYQGSGMFPPGTPLPQFQQLVQGFRTTPVQAAQVPNIQSSTNKNIADVPLIHAQTGETYAAAEKDLEATAAQKQSTGLAGAKAVAGANNDVANLNYQLGRTNDAIALTKGFANGSLTGGKIFNTIGEAQNFLGKNPQYAAYRDYLTTSNMQQIIAALQHQGRITGNEVQTFNSELLNGSMPFQTVEYLLGQQGSLLSTQKMNADIQARNVGGAVGAANPGMTTAPVTPSPIPQLSKAPSNYQVGGVYKDAGGRSAKYMGNGQWQPL